MINKILVIHGPNLNLLGEREPGVYGTTGIDTLNSNIIDRAKDQGLECDIFQSNHEGAIIDKLHKSRQNYDGIIINAGAYTHYSYAIRDAISSIKLPCIEVHISNIFAREEFRAHSVIAPVCKGSICGLGFASYYLAIMALAEMHVE